ncbi:hypothetical protein [Flavilitoribacter nigricans]|uniref:hypothetical protein n=1 Tax=Flavilitoribacter nigricans TaxID=70997 RepID=UPI0014749E45|nr:hypothetical protein [Flavilitoribacter nigricans]
MKLNKMKRLVVGLILLGAAASFSSCNRGYGCPNNFSVNDTAVKVVKEIVKSIK